MDCLTRGENPEKQPLVVQPLGGVLQAGSFDMRRLCKAINTWRVRVKYGSPVHFDPQNKGDGK